MICSRRALLGNAGDLGHGLVIEQDGNTGSTMPKIWHYRRELLCLLLAGVALAAFLDV